jgi:hypothetical protein
MMATESSAGGPPLGNNSSNTPPTTANPSRQPSVNKVANTAAADNMTAASAAAAGVSILPSSQPTSTVRDVRANSLAEPPHPNTTRSSVAQPTATTPTTTSSSSNNETISYSAERIIGNGSFGVVFQASVVESGEIVAIKKVLQDKRFKNRELQIMRQLVKDGHSNIVALKHCFYSQVSV